MMLTVTVNSENPKAVAFPPEELERLGIAEGDEIGFARNETGEIVLRSKKSEMTQKILDKTREIIERRRSALIELGKGHE